MSNTDYTLEYSKKPLPGKVFTIGIILTVIGIALLAIAYSVDYVRASFNIILLFSFVASISLCSIFLIALEYLAGAVWSVPFRRITEFLASLVLILPILALPVLLDLHTPFHWTHLEAIESDPILAGKRPYLNETFFVVRFIVIFILMSLFYWIFTSRSQKQDLSKDQKFTTQNIKFSAIFMLFFAVSMTIIALDWLMSLEPHWYSTIFGVYYFSGSVLAALAVVTLFSVILNEAGYLPKGITEDHYYSLGALMFAFSNFWAYIAFSQFMLIWYANLPEETFWYIQRGEGSWLYVSIGLIFVRFIIPYALLVSQTSKKNPRRLKFVSIWVLAAHFYDLYWLIAPNYSKDNAIFGWIELGVIILATGLIIVVFNLAAKNRNLIPIGDPKLKRAMEFRL